jgi:hypothetical protein
LLAHHARVRGGELGAGLLQRGARGEPAEQLRHPVPAFVLHRRPEVVRARDHVGEELGLGRIGHARLEDADHGRRGRAQLDAAADDGRIAMERRGPERVREHGHVGRLTPVIGSVQEPAEHGAKPHDLEERPVDHARGDEAGLPARADQREVHRGEVAERADGLRARFEVADLGHGEGEVVGADAECGLADVDQPVGIAVDERPQQHGADDAEDGGVGADPERERHHHGQREALGAEQRAAGEAEVAGERLRGVEPARPPHALDGFAGEEDVAELLDRGEARGFRVLAAIDPLLDGKCQVGADLLIELVDLGGLHAFSSRPAGGFMTSPMARTSWVQRSCSRSSCALPLAVSW